MSGQPCHLKTNTPKTSTSGSLFFILFIMISFFFNPSLRGTISANRHGDAEQLHVCHPCKHQPLHSRGNGSTCCRRPLTAHKRMERVDGEISKGNSLFPSFILFLNVSEHLSCSSVLCFLVSSQREHHSDYLISLLS